MNKAGGPNLKEFLEKRISVKLHGGRQISGILRGYDVYLNLVIDSAVEDISTTERNHMGFAFIRGTSVHFLEALERTV